MAAKANLLIDQGTDFSTTLDVTDDNGDVIDLTGYSANGHIRKHYTSQTATVFDCTIASPATSGRLTISLARSITENMEAGRYVYDVELTTAANSVSRLVEGVVTITPQVTKA
jgi:hypothetical protein